MLVIIIFVPIYVLFIFALLNYADYLQMVAEYLYRKIGNFLKLGVFRCSTHSEKCPCCLKPTNLYNLKKK